MTVRHPNAAEVKVAASELGFGFSDEDAESFRGLMDSLFGIYDVLDGLVEPLPEVKYPRTPGHRPLLEGKEMTCFAAATAAI